MAYVFKEYPKWLEVEGGITVKNRAEEDAALKRAGIIPQGDTKTETVAVKPAVISSNPADKIKIVRRGW